MSNPMIQVLYRVRDEIERELKHKQQHPVVAPIYRYDSFEVDEYKQELAELKQQLDITTQNIIGLERDERDPEQDAEIRMELMADMRMNGVHDDVSLYMHTPMQERLFQEQIQLELERDPDNQFYQPMVGNCPLCNRTTWEDEWQCVNGQDMCDSCAPDAAAWLMFLSLFVDPDEWEFVNWPESDWNVDNFYATNVSQNLRCGECGRKQVVQLGRRDQNTFMRNRNWPRLYCYDCGHTVKINEQGEVIVDDE